MRVYPTCKKVLYDFIGKTNCLKKKYDYIKGYMI